MPPSWSIAPTLAARHRRPGDTPSTEIDAPESGARKPEEHGDRGGLAGAVGAEQGDRLAAADAEADVVDGEHGAEATRDAVDATASRSPW